jgi:hypothetical protein
MTTEEMVHKLLDEAAQTCREVSVDRMMIFISLVAEDMCLAARKLVSEFAPLHGEDPGTLVPHIRSWLVDWEIPERLLDLGEGEMHRPHRTLQ